MRKPSHFIQTSYSHRYLVDVFSNQLTRLLTLVVGSMPTLAHSFDLASLNSPCIKKEIIYSLGGGIQFSALDVALLNEELKVIYSKVKGSLAFQHD